jgi:non-canonical purine NTP pyrophosphatase (RdgB/HAM1 family)
VSGRRIVLASGNAHKAVELARVLPGWDVQPFGGGLPEETGETFAENALLKARHVHAAIGGGDWVLADDSGIEAAALGGVPGVRSARYAGEDATDEANLAKLLAALEGRADRRVRYVAELVAIAPDGSQLHGRGELTGTLARAPRERRVRLRPRVRPGRRDAHGGRDGPRGEGLHVPPRPRRRRPAAPAA